MSMNNKVLLDGHLGASAELRYMPDGTAVASLRLATNETYSDKSGDRKTTTEWHSCQAFGRLAEILGEHGTKGKHLRIEGRLRTKKYTDKAGVDHYPTSIVIEEFRFGPMGVGQKPGDPEVSARASAEDAASEFASPESVPF